MALLGGVGAASALASFWVPALAAVAYAVAYVVHRRRRTAARDGGPGPVGPGVPAVGTEHRG
ncbi:hypothetical protein [Streptomyces sp. NPDC058155]|uniref:hypothetical protein n=1 Tax=Streptomyces sp. NPDC058155 TaxID=3346359 RepID=UPI0036F00056